MATEPLTTDEELLLALLNSTPMVDGSPQDQLDSTGAVLNRLGRFGADGSPRERTELLRARTVLQDAVSGRLDMDEIVPSLHGVRRTPFLAEGRLDWRLETPAHHELAVRAVLAWAELTEHRPGRLRPCENDECRLFLLDRSKANSARWCSMASCGNRLKARRHQQRLRR